MLFFQSFIVTRKRSGLFTFDCCSIFLWSRFSVFLWFFRRRGGYHHHFQWILRKTLASVNMVDFYDVFFASVSCIMLKRSTTQIFLQIFLILRPPCLKRTYTTYCLLKMTEVQFIPIREFI